MPCSGLVYLFHSGTVREPQATASAVRRTLGVGDGGIDASGPGPAPSLQ